MAISSLDTLNLKTFLDQHVTKENAFLMRGIHVDKVQDKIGEIITQLNLNLTDIDTIEAYDPATISPIQSAVTVLVDVDILEDTVGTIGHANGAVLVAAQGSGSLLEFISATLIYDRVTGPYAGGNDVLVIRVGVNGAQVTFSSVIVDEDLIVGTGDKVVQVNALTISDQALTITGNNIISLYSPTKFTAGTGEGTLTCHVQYRVHTTGL